MTLVSLLFEFGFVPPTHVREENPERNVDAERGV